MEWSSVEVGVSELVALVNQTLDYAYPEIVVTGELANVRVSKGKWLYFDLKDDGASVKFFGTVFMLPGPLEEGMLVKVRATPRLHNLYGFSMNVQSIQPAGEGSIKKAAQLLQAKLAAEGLFDDIRKRALPFPPRQIGLVASSQSAAYADFIKIINSRWSGLDIALIDVQVQGEPAPQQISAAIEQFGGLASLPDVLVMIRGGGSAEDLAAFSTELVTRAVAASRIPTLVAIGHETDLSLAELAADRRASTPSNAAELLVPDKQFELERLSRAQAQLDTALSTAVKQQRQALTNAWQRLDVGWGRLIERLQQELKLQRQLLQAYSPEAPLQRGYVIVRSGGAAITNAKTVGIRSEP